ncbi:MAG: chromate transporter [Clostridia bacterium]|nr:chromate transporter [Clostridia bacterium]
MIYLYLIKEFVLIGCFSFGGGLVMIPFIRNIAEVTGIITEEQLIEMVAISEITPGPLAVNMATYVGYIINGTITGIITTIALIVPQIIIIHFIFLIFKKFKDNKDVKAVLKGIKPVSLALTLGVAISIFKTTFLVKVENKNNFLNIFNWKSILLGIIMFSIMRKIEIHPIFYFVISAVIGIVFSF